MRAALAAVIGGAFVSMACGDQLMVTGQTKEGNFHGYENGRFNFVTAKGRSMREQAIRVTKLVLTSPQKVAFETTDGKKPEVAQLTGYEKRAFHLLKDGTELAIPLAKMKSVEISFEGAGGRTAEDPNQYPVPDVNMAELEAADATPAQKAALEGFKGAKKRFDDYVAKSSALVQEMDRAMGVKREELLNELRQRKNEEQPLKRALEKAYDALAEAFPAPAE